MNQTQKQLPDVPIEYAGQWVAWNGQRSKIIASGKDFAEVNRATEKTGEKHPLFEKVPRPDTRYVGCL